MMVGKEKDNLGSKMKRNQEILANENINQEKQEIVERDRFGIVESESKGKINLLSLVFLPVQFFIIASAKLMFGWTTKTVKSSQDKNELKDTREGNAKVYNQPERLFDELDTSEEEFIEKAIPQINSLYTRIEVNLKKTQEVLINITKKLEANT